MTEERPLYAVLGVPGDASAGDIKQAYRRLALEHHPDKRQAGADEAEANSLFARIAFAYEVLGHTQRRKRYDLTGEVPQTDSALGRKAGATFLAEYVKSAPKVSAATTGDMSLHKLENYEVMEVEGRDVPDYFRDIVLIGLNYLVKVVPDMEKKDVVLLRHYVMDQMYVLLAYEAPLDEVAFSERGYPITYYDHPLQSGITPSWSDTNEGRPQRDATSEMKNIDAVTMERRKLVALEWDGGAPAAPSAGKAASQVPGTGDGDERLCLGIRELLKILDPMSCNIHQVRRELEKILELEQHALDGRDGLLAMVFQVIAEVEEEQEDEHGAAEAEAMAAMCEEPGPPVINRCPPPQVSSDTREVAVPINEPAEGSGGSPSECVQCEGGVWKALTSVFGCSRRNKV